jgi:hypothetical protein
MNAYLSILGKKVRDRVTGREGIATSVSFDLYGCVQVTVDSGFSEKNERMATWFDHNRLTVVDETPVMEQPVYAEQPPHRHGPAEKGVGR